MAVKQKVDLGGNVIVTSAVAVGADKPGIPATGIVNILTGTGAPTLTAPKGSLYLNLSGSTTNDRAYINTNGATTWTALTTAA